MLLFAAGTQGYFLSRSKLWESLALILVAFTLFRPGFWMDMIYPPLEKVEASKIYDVVEALPENGLVRVHVMGETLEGDLVDKVVMLPVGKLGPGKDRIEMAAGLELREEDGKMLVDNIVFGSAADKQKIDFDWEIVDVQKKADTPDKRWFYIPALALLFLVWKVQATRRDRDKITPAGEPSHV